MDKYRKVMKPKEDIQKSDEEIRVTAAGSVSAYVSRAATVFNELKKPYVIVQATGNALTKAVTAAEVIKRRFKGLHQITELKTVEIVDEYEPLEEGLDKVTDVRNVSVVEIKLSKEPLDSSDKGYQPPIDESLVKEFDPEDMMRGRGRGGGTSKGRGKGSTGRGRGKGKGRGKERAKAKARVPRVSMKMTTLHPRRAREKERARERARAKASMMTTMSPRERERVRAPRAPRAPRAAESPRILGRTATLRPRAANQKAKGDPTMIGAMRRRATASRPARAGASPPMILMAVESLAGSLVESPPARAKARARVATTEVQGIPGHFLTLFEACVSNRSLVSDTLQEED
mmetsp:Transcript_41097/g.89082  ORF Transcript_41097/g.89082 Transcript_41097/m.89082 type:complete len:346 (+) Transcript_41097:81-1118(+)